ncbi:hypothetical protein ABKN59_011868 [Abortiporus biennis]
MATIIIQRDRFLSGGQALPSLTEFFAYRHLLFGHIRSCGNLTKTHREQLGVKLIARRHYSLQFIGRNTLKSSLGVDLATFRGD